MQLFYLKYSKWILVSIAILSIAAGFGCFQLKFNYHFEDFFPVNDPDMESYHQHRSDFRTDNDFILIGIENEAGVFAHEFISRLDSFCDDLSTLPHTDFIEHPLNQFYAVKGPFGEFNKVPYLKLRPMKDYTQDSIRIFESKHLLGNMFSKKGKAVSVLIKTDDLISKSESDELINDLELLILKYEFDDLHYSGKSRGQIHIIKKMKVELFVFLSISIFLVAVVLFLTFRTSWGVWVSITVVLLSVLWLLGTMFLLNRSINLLTTLLPTILFVVGISDVIHLVSKYFEELRKGRHKHDALKTAYREVGLATFLTTLTTAVGFATLIQSDIMPLKELGVFTAIGVFFAFILAYTLLPSVLFLVKTPQVKDAPLESFFWNRILHRVFMWVLKHKETVLLCTASVLVFCLFFISGISINSHLLEDLPKNDPLRSDFDYFEKRFSGSRPFTMSIAPADSNIWNLTFLKDVDNMVNYLDTGYGLGYITSLNHLIKFANQAIKGGAATNYKLPANDKELQEIRKLLLRSGDRLEFWISKNQSKLAVNGKLGDIGSKAVNIKNDKLNEFVKLNPPTSQLSYNITGTAHLIDKNNVHLARNMVFGLSIAFLVISLIVLIIHRNITLVIISLICNILPLIMVGGFMGVAGIDLKVSTALIFSIAFGIAVDDSIHMLSKLKIELNKGKTLPYAVKRTFMSTGKAVLITSIILISGFAALVFSDFTSTFYIGLLISLALVFALLCDLILLPVLLFTIYRK